MDSAELIRRCSLLAQLTEEPGFITRTYLSPPMREVHRLLGGWMESAGMATRVDAAGNLRGVYGEGPRLMIGSHADTVPHAGAFDGVLGVLLGIALVERRPPCAIEVAAFSGAEGVRFGAPLIGCRALVGSPVTDPPVLTAMSGYGLDMERLAEAALDPEVRGYLEFHPEQRPVLDCMGLPLGVVDSIDGLSRWEISFEGRTGHAGTTPMDRRRDALTGAAEWIGLVEHVGLTTPGLSATIGKIQAEPGGGGVIPDKVRVSLDVRHAMDEVRERAREVLLDGAEQIADRRGLTVDGESRAEDAAMALDVELPEASVTAAGLQFRRMSSGAGYGARILGSKVPASIFLLRNAEGSVRAEDVDAALAAGSEFLRNWRLTHSADLT